jgi:hypothetical protein
MSTAWCKEAFEASVTSRCWWYTPYDDGWDNCSALAEDEELREVVAMEQALRPVPEWAQRIVERSINFACPCGHYLFPRPYLETLDAIGSATPRRFVHGCFTVDGERKRQMMDYVLCLDAWLAGARPDDAAGELEALGHRRIDWRAACAGLWATLGEHSERKHLLVERLLHSQRHKLKRSPWDDDPASQLGRDQYLGPIGGAGNPAKACSYIEDDVPGFDEGASPRVQRLEARLRELCPDWDALRFHIQFGWLCAPRAFRFLERLIWAIGQERAPRPDDPVPGFLQTDDTCPNQDDAATWWQAFCDALDAWWRGRPAAGHVADDVSRRLGESTPVKQWLVRLFLKKIRGYVLNDEGLARLVRPRPGARRGAGPLRTGAP